MFAQQRRFAAAPARFAAAIVMPTAIAQRTERKSGKETGTAEASGGATAPRSRCATLKEKRGE